MSRETIVPDGMQAMYDNFHFAPAVRSGKFVFCSGQIGIGPDGTPPENLEQQFHLAFEGVGAVLEKAGAELSDIVEMTTYHVGLQDHLQRFMAVKDHFVLPPYPAWSAIGVAELAVPGACVEIRVIARIEKD